MKMKFTLFISLFFLLLSGQSTFAQTAGDYRSIVPTGDWSTPGSWQKYDGTTWNTATTAPTSTDGVITIHTGDSIYLNANITIDQVVVETGAKLGLTGSAIILNNSGAANDLTITGHVSIKAGGNLGGTGNVLNTTNGILTVELSSYLGVPTTNNGTINFWQSSALQTVTLTNNNTINMQDNVYLLGGATLINNDSISILSGAVNLFTDASATLTNASGAVIYLSDPTTTLVESSAIAFTNNGAVHGFGSADFAGTAGGSNGTVKPGNGASSSLTVSPATLAGTPTLLLTLSPGGGSPTAGSTYDQLLLSGSGAVPLSAATLTVTDAASGDAVNTVYTLISSPSGSISSVPGAVNLPSTLGNLTNTGNSITVTRLTVLPLNWGTFTVTAEGTQAHLAWTTLQENNTARFTIERSADGVTFTAIGTVAAKGNTFTVSSYSFTDANPGQGFNYYRLAETDLDGKANYSLIRVINFGKTSSVIVQTSPNPVKDLLNIVVQEDDITILLSDMSGRALKTLRLAQGFHQTSIGDLTSGVYQLTIYKGSSKIDSRQIIKF